MSIQSAGGRKYTLGLVYLLGCFALACVVVWRDGDMVSFAAFPPSIATGLGVIVWGNIQEHRAKNGAPQPPTGN